MYPVLVAPICHRRLEWEEAGRGGGMVAGGHVFSCLAVNKVEDAFVYKKN